jgi:anti-sigma regulatory factor (Ser/Thr protein kinase)
LITHTMEHTLFVYGHDQELAERGGRFLQDGLDEGGATIMVVDDRKRELLHDALGSDGGRVRFIDCHAHYTRPEAALADYDLTLRQLVRDGAPHVRLFAELPVLEDPGEYRRWTAYEAIVNRAFAHHPVSIICGYDTRAVPADVVEDMRRTHPCLLVDPLADSPVYQEPAEVVRSLAAASAPVMGLAMLDFDGDVSALRRELRALMAQASVAPADADAMLLAADEVLANAERHGGGVRELRAGAVDGRFVFEISDSGPGFDDALAGYMPPTPVSGDGVGLWVARQVTRRLDLEPSGDGFTVRLWV